MTVSGPTCLVGVLCKADRLLADDDMYWLGNVPCRTARVIGLVVGIDNFDDMTRLKSKHICNMTPIHIDGSVFVVDDGTAVIDCDYKHPKAHKAVPSPSLKRHKRVSSLTKPSSSRGPETPSKSIPAKYRPPANASKPTSTTKQNNKSLLAEPVTVPPIDVGMTIRAIGRVMRGRGSRFLRVEPGNLGWFLDIILLLRILILHTVKCLSSNDEPQHWLEVTRLHRDSYASSEAFSIPKLETQQTQHTQENFVPCLASPSASSLIAPSSPIPISSPTKTASSPVRGSSTVSLEFIIYLSSSISLTQNFQPPKKPRLRHPSKLRTRDLTDITFRMYLKHYMDFAPPYRFAQETDDLQPERCTTPTPSSRLRYGNQLDSDTPRPSRAGAVSYPSSPAKANDEDDFDNSQYGFTLSYLRRVPVLAEMARAVVRAERKRREREARQREKAELAKSQASRAEPSSRSITTASSSKSSSKAPVHASTNSTSVSQHSGKGKASSEPTCKKMKRLFQKTLRELYAEGSIVLWTGGVRHWSHASGFDEDEKLDEGSSAMWKTSTSIGVGNLSMATTSTASSRAGAQTQGAEGDDSAGELSEPSAREEAYLPVTTTTMAPLILGAIRTLSLPPTQSTSGIKTQPSSLASRPTGRKQRHPTASEILAYLHAMDMRWERLGMWTIEEVLEKLRRDDRIYQIGEGRWALCV